MHKASCKTEPVQVRDAVTADCNPAWIVQNAAILGESVFRVCLDGTRIEGVVAGLATGVPFLANGIRKTLPEAVVVKGVREPFAGPGDSGALVRLSTNEIVGMVVAHSGDNVFVGQIDAALADFGGVVDADVHHGPGVAPNVSSGKLRKTSNNIFKIGLAVVRDGRLLVVRKRGKSLFILPGGKPEEGEGDLKALEREIAEELGCTCVAPRLEGDFSDVAAEMGDATVTVRLYSGELSETPRACSEIVELAWVELVGNQSVALAPSITNRILPHLARDGSTRPGVITHSTRIAEARYGDCPFLMHHKAATD